MQTDLTISDLAKELGVSLRTIRFWEGKGLVKPKRRGTRRFYDAGQAQKVRVVHILRNCNFSVREIKVWFDAGAGARKDMLHRQYALNEDQIEFLKSANGKIRDGLKDVEQGRAV